MDFLGAVNRVLVNNLILKGDDDLLTSFSESQHVATTRYARNAIQTELNNLTSWMDLPYEKDEGTIVTIAGLRTYGLPATFIRFWGSSPYFVDASDDTKRIYEWRGGEENLRQVDYTYLTNQGVENYWYWSQNTNKEIGFYQVPDDVRTYTYTFEKDISISSAFETIPLQTEIESQAFVDMASRRFKYMIEGQDVGDLEKDTEYSFNRSTLMNLMRNRNPDKKYGKIYR